jgi:hypothetical protein
MNDMTQQPKHTPAPKKHLALFNGHEMTAQRINGQWHVGGDTVPAGVSVSIVAKEFITGKWGWHQLKGSRLKFEDSCSEADLIKHNAIYNA